MGGEFTETIRPGAFRNALAEGQDVRALFNHDSNMLLGRTKSGTLRLSEDATGLRFEVDPPDSDVADLVVQAISRGDLDGCSFGFMVRDGGSVWTIVEGPDGDEQYNRELTDLDIYDVGPVTYPAYQDTSVAVRSLEGARRDTERGETPSVRDRLRLRLRLAEAGGDGSLPRVSPK